MILLKARRDELMLFDLGKFIETVRTLANDPQRLEKSMVMAETVKEEYGVDEVVDKWEALFDRLTTCQIYHE